MIGFEEFILNKGYTKMVYDYKLNKLRIPGKYEIISTYGPLEFVYVKEGFKHITYGLLEAGKPPVWVNPKPISLCTEEELNFGWIGNDTLNRIYQRHTNDEIYESINKNYE